VPRLALSSGFFLQSPGLGFFPQSRKNISQTNIIKKNNNQSNTIYLVTAKVEQKEFPFIF
jgi:hypothetical protein